MTEEKKELRIRYNSQEIESYLEQWKSSGKSQIAFSKEAGLNYYTFNKWLSESKTKSKRASKRQTGFIPIQVKEEKGVVFAEVKRTGGSIVFFQSVSAEYLRTLLQ